MKKSITSLILIIIFFICYAYKTEIITYIMTTSNDFQEVTPPTQNNYTSPTEFLLVKETDNFHVSSKQDILNVIYTVLNTGQTEFTFYCTKEYENCGKELEEISQDQTTLSVINNMVSPFNSYQKMFITTNNYGKATINIEKLYTKKDAEQIYNKIDEFKQTINPNLSIRNQIKAFHDYLINNTTYDEERADSIEKGYENTSPYNSHKANGPLLEGKALCSGYSDAMKIYLDSLNLKNYKVSTSKHIWNVVYLDNKWLHIDLTWDDPVTPTHQNVLLYTYFLVDTNKILSENNVSHNFDKKYYPELN